MITIYFGRETRFKFVGKETIAATHCDPNRPHPHVAGIVPLENVFSLTLTQRADALGCEDAHPRLSIAA
eukprot:3182859-Pleurochrysis_carterae.AAC.2